MLGNQQEIPTKRKQDLRGGFGLERCSNPECSQVFDEKSEVYWRNAPRKMICAVCESDVIFIGRDHSSDQMNRDIYIFWCSVCEVEHRLTVPMNRKYCGACKKEWYRSRTYYLRAPIAPHDLTSTCIPVSSGDTAA